MWLTTIRIVEKVEHDDVVSFILYEDKVKEIDGGLIEFRIEFADTIQRHFKVVVFSFYYIIKMKL